jgi:3-hydroxyacyl-[acyl-carrier-protein] dehydratase
MRYFLIDRVSEIEVGVSARGVKAVSLSDDLVHDHFPDHPLWPGMMILEGAAQLAGFLLETGQQPEDGPVRRALLVSVEKAKFHETAGPGDLLEFLAEIDSRIGDASTVRVMVTREGRKVARARLTFVLKAVESEALHAQRRRLYRLWTERLPSPPPIR